MKKQSRHYRRVRSVTLLLSMAAALALSASAFAQRDHRGVRPHARGDISRFHQSHVRHGGWRVTGGIWLGYPLVYPYPYSYPYSYPYPYPYPYSYPWAPPVAALGESAVPAVPPSAQYWYFCEASNTYYPYVASCPGGWRAVPATPRDASPVPQQ
jgi:hypothetical protein